MDPLFSPQTFSNDDNYLNDDNMDLMQEYHPEIPIFSFNEGSNIGEMSNDFDSSIMGHKKNITDDIFGKFEDVPMTPVEPKPIPQIHPKPLVALSPKLEVPIDMQDKKSTEYRLEPEVFKIDKKKSKITPIILTPQDSMFYNVLMNPQFQINPKQLEFIPSTYWPDQSFTFGDVVQNYFRLKNNENARFQIKLYNALKLTSKCPDYIQYVGIMWVTDYVILVDSTAFGRFLNIKSVKGSLFHSQGNFPAHGFVEIMSKADAIANGVPQSMLGSIDFDLFKLWYHKDRLLSKTSTEQDISKIQWTSKNSQ